MSIITIFMTEVVKGTAAVGNHSETIYIEVYLNSLQSIIFIMAVGG